MTTLDPSRRTDVPAMQQEVRRRFGRFRRRLRGQMLLAGVARLALVLAGVLGLSLLLDWWLELSRPARLAFALVGLAAIAAVAWCDVVRPMRMRMGVLDLAWALDRVRGGVATGRLAPWVASVLELPDVAARAEGTSPALAQRAVYEAYGQLAQVDLGRQVSGRHLARHALLVTAAVLAIVVVAGVSPWAGVWSERWLLWREVAWPRTTTLTVAGLAGERMIVPRGEPVMLRVTAHDDTRDVATVSLHLRTADGRRYDETLTRFDAGAFRYELPPLQAQAQLWLRGGDQRVGPIVLHPADRPRLADLRLTHHHPRDASPRHHRLTETAVSLLAHSRATLELTADMPVAEVQPLTTAEAEHALPALHRKDPQTFTADWIHERAMVMRVQLVAAKTGLRSAPILVAVGLQPDRLPGVRLRHEHVQQRITRMATLPLTVEAQDDFGLAMLRLHVRPETPRYHTRLDDEADDQTPTHAAQAITLHGPVESPVDRRLVRPHQLDVASLDLAVGDLLHLHAAATDDRHPAPQTAGSQTLVFRIVGAEELFREILLRQQDLRARFRQATTEAAELRDRMREPAAPSDVDALLRRFRLNQRAVWQVTGGFEETVAQMRYNRLGGEEAYELIERSVLTPLTRLHEQTMTRQREALGRLAQSPGGHESLDPIIARQDRLVQDMEAVLRQMAQWDSFIDVVNQLDEILDVQQQVHERTREIRDRQTESIFDD